MKHTNKNILWKWKMLSLASVLLLWFILSLIPRTSRSFPFLNEVLPSIALMIQRGVLWKDISSSMIAILIGFALGFVSAIPVAFIMAWYTPVRNIIEPWIQFKKYPGAGICAPDRYLGGCRTEIPDHCDLACMFYDYVYHDLSGNQEH